jgi:hypothetical protein
MVSSFRMVNSISKFIVRPKPRNEARQRAIHVYGTEEAGVRQPEEQAAQTFTTSAVPLP